VKRGAVDIHPDLVDRMIELYCDWRTACAAVWAAYERFGNASATDRARAFAAYIAALDREQSACESYAAHIRVIEGRLAGGDAGELRPELIESNSDA
jgi:hypothetical protein